ncbi:hypothetical protein Pelo_1674 [Pelomyxa schiedti]|nr:hypothetical protein Pelo_1674 [Pelomyxa schiedti]
MPKGKRPRQPNGAGTPSGEQAQETAAKTTSSSGKGKKASGLTSALSSLFTRSQTHYAATSYSPGGGLLPVLVYGSPETCPQSTMHTVRCPESACPAARFWASEAELQQARREAQANKKKAAAAAAADVSGWNCLYTHTNWKTMELVIVNFVPEVPRVALEGGWWLTERARSIEMRNGHPRKIALGNCDKKFTDVRCAVIICDPSGTSCTQTSVNLKLAPIFPNSPPIHTASPLPSLFEGVCPVPQIIEQPFALHLDQKFADEQAGIINRWSNNACKIRSLPALFTWSQAVQVFQENFNVDVSALQAQVCGTKSPDTEIDRLRWNAFAHHMLVVNSLQNPIIEVDKYCLEFWQTRQWFHGFITRQEAEQILQSYALPCALLRCGQSDPCLLTLSQKLPTGIYHQNIAKTVGVQVVPQIRQPSPNTNAQYSPYSCSVSSSSASPSPSQNGTPLLPISQQEYTVPQQQHPEALIPSNTYGPYGVLGTSNDSSQLLQPLPLSYQPESTSTNTTQASQQSATAAPPPPCTVPPPSQNNNTNRLGPVPPPPLPIYLPGDNGMPSAAATATVTATAAFIVYNVVGRDQPQQQVYDTTIEGVVCRLLNRALFGEVRLVGRALHTLTEACLFAHHNASLL